MTFKPWHFIIVALAGWQARCTRGHRCRRRRDRGMDPLGRQGPFHRACRGGQLGLDRHKIDLLITDVVMLGWSGPELVKHFQAARPGVPVLMISGHTGNVLTAHGVVPPDVNLLIKPFSSQTLARTVRKMLGWPRRP